MPAHFEQQHADEVFPQGLLGVSVEERNKMLGIVL